MEKTKTIYSVVALLAAFSCGSAIALEGTEEFRLAEDYGCIACHALEPKKQNVKADDIEVLPVGPSLREIAERFHSNPDADKYKELYRIVKYGSSPFRSKWQGEVSGLAMPPNDETISDLDINRLLVWMLTSYAVDK